MKRRILFASLFHETHTFLDDPTTQEDMSLLVDRELLAKSGDGSPTDGFLQVARELDWEVIPTIGATAMPSGVIADEVFELFWSELALRARPALATGIDGIFLVLHGAMATQSLEDAEGELLTRVRSLPGARATPLFGVLDLHANVSPRMCALANGLVTYRKNPHTDAKAAAIRAAYLLQRCLKSGRVPHMHWCRVPLLLPPPGTGTDSDPMLSLTRLAEQTERSNPEVWAYNVAAGFAFADTADSGVTLSLVTTQSLDAVQPYLAAGADLAWRLRETGDVAYPDVGEVLKRVRPAARGPVLLVEPADNIGGGAPGDGTAVLRAMIAGDLDRALVCINDPQAVAAVAHTPVGSTVSLRLGGRGWRLDEGPITADVRLLACGGGAFQFEDPKNHLASIYGSGFDMGPCAVVGLRGTTVLLTSNKTPPFDLGQYRSQGINPEAFSWIDVKAAVAHRQAYDPIAAASYFVDTPGPCSSNLHRLPYQRLQRPVYPLDSIDLPALRYA